MSTGNFLNKFQSTEIKNFTKLLSDSDIDGLFKQKVIDDKDPLNKLRVKIRIPFIFDDLSDEELPYQEQFSGMSNFLGKFEVPRKGSYIYVFYLNGSITNIKYIPQMSYSEPIRRKEDDDIELTKKNQFNQIPQEFVSKRWSLKEITDKSISEDDQEYSYSPYPIIEKHPNNNTNQDFFKSDFYDNEPYNQYRLWGNMYLQDNDIRKQIEKREYSPFDETNNNYSKKYLSYDLENNELLFINREQNDFTFENYLKDLKVFSQIKMNSVNLPDELNDNFQDNLFVQYDENLKEKIPNNFDYNNIIQNTISKGMPVLSDINYFDSEEEQYISIKNNSYNDNNYNRKNKTISINDDETNIKKESKFNTSTYKIEDKFINDNLIYKNNIYEITQDSEIVINKEYIEQLKYNKNINIENKEITKEKDLFGFYKVNTNLSESQLTIDREYNNMVDSLNIDQENNKIAYELDDTFIITFDKNKKLLRIETDDQVYNFDGQHNVMSIEGNSDNSSKSQGDRVQTLKHIEDLWTFLLKHQHIGNMGQPTPLFPQNVQEQNITKTNVKLENEIGGNLRIKDDYKS